MCIIIMLLSLEMKCVLLAILLVLSENVYGNTRTDPLVETKLGQIRGLRATDGDYSMFLGIPFGDVDKNNVFGPSTPHPPFEGVFEAYDDTAICPQREEYNNTIVGTLDCLQLNIYVPINASSQNKLPVLVFVYGGSFIRGFAGRYVYGPKYLVRHDIILVTVNYRVGPYGFMCLHTPEIPGNQGLKDQLLALRWIRDHIENFGGDANKVSFYGRSAGGVAVDLHLLSPQEKLFDKVILGSGSAKLSSVAPREGDPLAPITLARQLNYDFEDPKEALTFLNSLDPIRVIQASESMSNFIPCVEKEFEGVEIFITDYPINLKVPKAKDMPILIGVNDKESYYNFGGGSLVNYNNFNQRLRTAFEFSPERLAKMETYVRQFYIGDEPTGESVRDILIDFTSDFRYVYPSRRSIYKFVDNDAGNVYNYLFSYVGGRNYQQYMRNVTLNGAVHTDEIGYLFDVSFITEEPSVEDQLTIDRMTSIWANFVKYGNPVPETSDVLPINWTPVTSRSNIYCMDINKDLSIIKRPYHRSMAFWDLFYKINEKYQHGFKSLNH